MLMAAGLRPDGQITCPSVNPLLKKYSDLQKWQIRPISFLIPSHKRGVRDRHGRGAGMRWTRRVRRTSAPDADGEDVWARHPDAGVKFALRRADDGGKKPGRRGEHVISRKPLRGECRVIPV